MRHFTPYSLCLFILLAVSHSDPIIASTAGWTTDHDFKQYFKRSSCGSYDTKQEAIDKINQKCANGELGFYSHDDAYLCQATVVREESSCNSLSWVSPEYRETPTCPEGSYNPDSDQCEATPQECDEVGKYYDPATQQCATECANGAMDNQCLITPDSTCSESSDDYQGTVGWGEDHRPVCSGDTSCGDNEKFAYREMNDGSWGGVCVSSESNPPTCPYGFEGVLEIYDNGFACGQLNEDKESDKNDSSNGDSDGDGQADDNGMAGQLEDIKGLLRDGNTETGNIGESLKKGFSDLTDAIGDIPGGGGSGDGSGDGDGDGETEDPVTWSGEAISLELSDGLEELNAVQGEYENLIANIRAEMAASFGSFTGSGGLQDNPITLYGESFNAGLSKFGADLSILGSIILFAATFIALGIIMGARD